jgi:hypothetical protein
MEIKLNAFLTSVPYLFEQSEQLSRRLTPGERTPVTHWIWGCSPTARMDMVARWKEMHVQSKLKPRSLSL